jgi:hypothetical protein
MSYLIGLYQHLKKASVNVWVQRRIILRCIFRKWNVGAWTGLSWLRIGTGGGALVNAVMNLRIPSNAGKIFN